MSKVLCTFCKEIVVLEGVGIDVGPMDKLRMMCKCD